MTDFLNEIAPILQKCDVAYLVAGPTVDMVSLNLSDSSRFTLTPEGDTLFEENYGLRSEATDAHWATGFIPAIHATRMQLTDCEIGVFVLDNAYDPEISSPAEWGNSCNMIKAMQTQLVTGAPTTPSARIGRNATFQGTSVVKTAIGLTSVSREGTQTKIWRNGDLQCGSAGSTPTGLGNDEMYLCGANGFTSSFRRIGFAYAGARLTTEERTLLYRALVEYLTSIGAYNPADADAPPVPGGPDPYAPSPEYVWSEEHQGAALDMTGLEQIFETVWDSPSKLGLITTDGGAGPWFAPVHSTVGKAVFQLPGTDAFAIVDGALRLRCYPTNAERTEWATGHLQSSDTSGAGFSQTKGYWEFEGKMPAAGTKSAWPAFWLYGTELYTAPQKTRPEIDVIEYYPGNDPRGHHAAVHLRPGSPYQTGEVSKHWNKSSYQGMDAIRDGGWHTYGVEVGNDLIVIYMDRLEVCRMPAHPDFLVPLHMLISLQMYSDEWQQATSPIDFFCHYARVYRRAS